MTVDRCLLLLATFLAGTALGGIFFGGLWLTIRHTLSSAALGVWLVGSFVVRMAIAVAGFYVIYAGDWQRLMGCLIGFVTARFVIARVLRPTGVVAAGIKVSHAP